MKTTRTITTALLTALSFAPLTTAASRFSTLYTAAGWIPVGLTSAGGALYGAAAGEGATGIGCGEVFQLQPPVTGGRGWSKTTLYSFTGMNGDVCDPIFAPTPGTSGDIYGLAYEGGLGLGGLYELHPPASPGGQWGETVPYTFGVPGSAGYALSGLVRGPGGSYYVLTSAGTYGWGALFQLQPPTQPDGIWTGTVLYSLPIPGGALNGPPNSLTMGSNGLFYGTTAAGGTAAAKLGTVFQLTPPSAPGGTWTQTILHNFGHGDGSTPNSLTVAGDGTIYGTTLGTNFWTNGSGAVFSLTPPTSPGGAWTYTVLKDVGRYGSPNSALILRSGNLYGTFMGADGGTVFELQPPSTPGGAWVYTSLHKFTDFQQPGGTLVLDEGGTLYGVTTTAPSQPVGGTVYAIALQ